MKSEISRKTSKFGLGVQNESETMLTVLSGEIIATQETMLHMGITKWSMLKKH